MRAFTIQPLHCPECLRHDLCCRWHFAASYNVNGHTITTIDIGCIGELLLRLSVINDEFMLIALEFLQVMRRRRLEMNGEHSWITEHVIGKIPAGRFLFASAGVEDVSMLQPQPTFGDASSPACLMRREDAWHPDVLAYPETWSIEGDGHALRALAFMIVDDADSSASWWPVMQILRDAVVCRSLVRHRYRPVPMLPEPPLTDNVDKYTFGAVVNNSLCARVFNDTGTLHLLDPQHRASIQLICKAIQIGESLWMRLDVAQ